MVCFYSIRHVTYLPVCRIKQAWRVANAFKGVWYGFSLFSSDAAYTRQILPWKVQSQWFSMMGYIRRHLTNRSMYVYVYICIYIYIYRYTYDFVFQNHCIASGGGSGPHQSQYTTWADDVPVHWRIHLGKVIVESRHVHTCVEAWYTWSL